MSETHARCVRLGTSEQIVINLAFVRRQKEVATPVMLDLGFKVKTFGLGLGLIGFEAQYLDFDLGLDEVQSLGFDLHVKL